MKVGEENQETGFCDRVFSALVTCSILAMGVLLLLFLQQLAASKSWNFRDAKWILEYKKDPKATDENGWASLFVDNPEMIINEHRFKAFESKEGAMTWLNMHKNLREVHLLQLVDVPLKSIVIDKKTVQIEEPQAPKKVEIEVNITKWITE
jgi:hypothetical protein